MLTTADQLLAHCVGDYVIQSDWMAIEKTEPNARGVRAAAAHAATYALPFIQLGVSRRALAVIAGTHFAIDHWRLARQVCWAKNQVAPASYRYPLGRSDFTGYLPKPHGLEVELMIVADNVMHVLINGWAIRRWPR